MNPRHRTWLLQTLVGLAAAWPLTTPMVCAAGEPSLPAVVEFNRDVRPILSNNCFQCHGPDKAKRKAGLRFDNEDGAFADLGDGRRAITRGDAAKSLMVQRISAPETARRMPPAATGKTLSERQIALIRRWIEQGAKWQKHWSLIPPARPLLPRVQHGERVRNAIDAFILARLESEGQGMSPEADRTTLIRRVTLDLTGLPPTPAEVDAFLADQSPDAYDKVVDRLLRSPRYGERMASRWLDAARYADTNGYQNDGERFMWRWRDWVIDAFNADMPFDQFTVEQLAGDMLPNPTLGQRIATGFNRNHRGNAEGGIIPEEYAAEYVVDRVETTATVWLGLTMGCARCHDHKFDPIAQRDFYRVFAYFNNVPENGRAVKYGNSPPLMQAPTPDQQQRLKELEAMQAAAESAWERLGPEVAAAQAEWEKSLQRTAQPLQWSPANGLLAYYPLDGNTNNQGSQARSGTFQDGGPAFAAGRLGRAADFDGKRFIDAGDVAAFGFYDRFSCGAWIYPRGEHGGTVLSRMTDAEQGDGYSLEVKAGKVQVNLVKRWLDDALRVETENSLAPDRWHHVMMTYDGSRVAKGVAVYIDGRPAKLKVLLDELNQSFETKEPLRIGAGGGPGGRFLGSINDVRVYSDCLSATDVGVVATPDTISDIAAVPPGKRTAQQADKVQACFLEKYAPDPLRQAHQQVVGLRRQRERLIENFPTTMVMEEMPTPRETFVLLRGQYDRHGEKVTPGVPASLPA
ncbi:MAG TPA: DUF1549 domain-containing protein, partial [Gemmataceae bacterium]|nr:DUF1549 domain-containing protein [Gemmataceae bacterium]